MLERLCPTSHILDRACGAAPSSRAHGHRQLRAKVQHGFALRAAATRSRRSALRQPTAGPPPLPSWAIAGCTVQLCRKEERRAKDTGAGTGTGPGGEACVFASHRARTAPAFDPPTLAAGSRASAASPSAACKTNALHTHRRASRWPRHWSDAAGGGRARIGSKQASERSVHSLLGLMFCSSHAKE